MIKNLIYSLIIKSIIVSLVFAQEISLDSNQNSHISYLDIDNVIKEEQINQEGNRDKVKKHNFFIGAIYLEGTTYNTRILDKIENKVTNYSYYDYRDEDLNNSSNSFTLGYSYNLFSRFRVGLEISRLKEVSQYQESYNNIRNTEEVISNLNDYYISMGKEDSVNFSSKHIKQTKIISTYEFDLYKGKKFDIFLNAGVGFALNNIITSYKKDSKDLMIWNHYQGTYLNDTSNLEDFCQEFYIWGGYNRDYDYIGYIENGVVFTQIDNKNINISDTLSCVMVGKDAESVSINEEVVTALSSIPLSFGIGINHRITENFIWQIKAGYINNTIITTEIIFADGIKAKVDFSNSGYTEITTGLVIRF